MMQHSTNYTNHLWTPLGTQAEWILETFRNKKPGTELAKESLEKKEWLNVEDSKIWTKQSFLLIISKKSEFFSGTQEVLLTCLLKRSKWPVRTEFIKDWKLASNLAHHLQNFTNQYKLNILRYFLCCKELFCFEGCQYLFSTKPPELNVAVQPGGEDEE